jgi:carbonic anhydrase
MLNLKLYLLVTTILSLELVRASPYNAEKVSYKESGRDWDEGVCSYGQLQSPIDIPLNEETRSENFQRLVYSENVHFDERFGNITSAVIEDRGPALWVSLKDKGNITFWDENLNKSYYDALQFHFHAPSEHTFDGNHYDLEMHIVHYN